jgi:hypothetical protein
MRQMLKVVLRWFPDRHFVFAGDGGVIFHPESSHIFHGHRPRLWL